MYNLCKKRYNLCKKRYNLCKKNSFGNITNIESLVTFSRGKITVSHVNIDDCNLLLIRV